MGTVMNNHLHLGHVGALLRDRRYLADSWLRKRGDARELFRNSMRQVDEGAKRAGDLRRREITPSLPAMRLIRHRLAHNAILFSFFSDALVHYRRLSHRPIPRSSE